VTASAKVTDHELAELECAATRRGVRLGEWIRDLLLREASCRLMPPMPIRHTKNRAAQTKQGHSPARKLS